MAESSQSRAANGPVLEMPNHLNPLARVLVVDDSATILKVVGTILARAGYEAHTARDGTEGLDALKVAGPFDLILLDFVMPRMNGYQFCRELRNDPMHSELPVVLMSARTAAIGDRFVEQTGAADALSKPFDARALVAVVGKVLSRARDGSTARRVIQPEEMLDEAELDAPESVAPPSRHNRTMNKFATQIAEAITPHIRRLSQRDLSHATIVSDTIARSLDDAILVSLVRTIGDLDEHVDSTEVMRGDTVRMPLAEVMQMLQLQRQTGVVYVEHKRARVILSVRQGQIDFAQSTGAGHEFRLGRYFVEAGLVSFEEIDSTLAGADEGTMIGQALLAAGKITSEQLDSALVKQSCELVYEVMRWPKGRFILRDEPHSEAAQTAALGLGTSELVLEGFRRVDEWRLMADSINFEDIPVVDQMALGTLSDGKLSLTELPVLEAIDGKRTVREVIEASALASFDAISIIYGFLQSRIVRVK